MTQKQTFNNIIRERDAAFEADDLSWVCKQLPLFTAPKIVKMTFHKARYETASVSDKKRLESQQWLAERRLKRMNGEPVNIGDPLPQ